MDITRSMDIFDPNRLKYPIHVIGAGATGSNVVKNLILQGISGRMITVYDFDVVESHNIANQYYTQRDIGLLKVEALQRRIEDEYGEKINTVAEEVKDCSGMDGVVFLLVDGKRGPLFETMKFRPNIKLLIETGLEARVFRYNLISPSNLSHIGYFNDRVIKDEEKPSTEVFSVCGTRQVVSNTVSMLAAAVVWDFVKWVNDPNNMGHHVYVSMDPWFMKQWQINEL